VKLTPCDCAAGANMCANSADFNPAHTLGEDGEYTCADISDAFFDRIPGGASTWADVTCSNMKNPREAGEAGTTLWALTQHAEPCCGGRDKVRCFDGSTMCNDAADFEPGRITELAGNPDAEVVCSFLDSYYLTLAGENKVSWDGISCTHKPPAEWLWEGAPETIGGFLSSASACCGGQAKTRCEADGQLP
jgi:hypothetical protein